MLTAILGGYEQISDEFFCEHVDGGEAVNCRTELSAVYSCREQCDKWPSCIGYSEQPEVCYLFPSDGKCPADWISQTSDHTIAKTSSQLLVRTAPGYTCYRNSMNHID